MKVNTKITEMVAEQVNLQLRSDGAVPIEPRPVDDEEKLRGFIQRGCGYTLVNNDPCSMQFSLDHYRTIRASSAGHLQCMQISLLNHCCH